MSSSPGKPPRAPRGKAVPEARPSRGRPPTISREKLLDVAREVFLERGVRATTAEVAERAGVSEGTVFHRFKSKDLLFHEAMHFDFDEMPTMVEESIRNVEGLEIREALVELGAAMLQLGRVVLPLVMMSWSNPDQCLPDENKRATFVRMVRSYIVFFEQRIQKGEIRRVDPEILTRSFMGSLHQYCMSELTMQNTNELALPEGLFVRGLVDLLLTGAAPQEVPAATASTRRLSRG